MKKLLKDRYKDYIEKYKYIGYITYIKYLNKGLSDEEIANAGIQRGGNRYGDNTYASQFRKAKAEGYPYSYNKFLTDRRDDRFNIPW